MFFVVPPLWRSSYRDSHQHSALIICPLLRVCSKVGFNAGHSSLNWLLSSHPSTDILAFDLGEYDYMKHAVDFLQVEQVADLSRG